MEKIKILVENMLLHFKNAVKLMNPKISTETIGLIHHSIEATEYLGSYAALGTLYARIIRWITGITSGVIVLTFHLPTTETVVLISLSILAGSIFNEGSSALGAVYAEQGALLRITDTHGNDAQGKSLLLKTVWDTLKKTRNGRVACALVTTLPLFTGLVLMALAQVIPVSEFAVRISIFIATSLSLSGRALFLFLQVTGALEAQYLRRAVRILLKGDSLRDRTGKISFYDDSGPFVSIEKKILLASRAEDIFKYVKRLRTLA